MAQTTTLRPTAVHFLLKKSLKVTNCALDLIYVGRRAETYESADGKAPDET